MGHPSVSIVALSYLRAKRGRQLEKLWFRHPAEMEMSHHDVIKFRSKLLIFVSLQTWWMTLKNNCALLLCYFKLCASFHSHQLIQTGVTVRKHHIWVKIGNFWSRVTLKFDRWLWKTIRHLFYATLSFVHHFIVIGQFKLEWQSRNAQFAWKTAIFCPLWPRNLTNNLEK